MPEKKTQERCRYLDGGKNGTFCKFENLLGFLAVFNMKLACFFYSTAILAVVYFDHLVNKKKRCLVLDGNFSIQVLP